MKKYIIFGTGVIGEIAYKLLGSDKVYGFCDNNPHDNNDTFIEKPVFNADKLSTLYDSNDHTLVLSTTKPQYVIEITRQLDGMEIPFVLLEDIATEIVRDEGKAYEALNPPDSFRVKSLFNIAKSYGFV